MANLKRKRVDGVECVTSFLTQRSTELRFPGYQSGKTNIETGNPQGSPLSLILLLFYNIEILERCQEQAANGITATGYINDIALLAMDDSTAETCGKLREIHEKACVI